MSEDETPRERIAYLAYACVAWLGHVLPTHTGRMLFDWAGRAAYHLAPDARAVVAANQARVLGRPTDDPLVVASTRQAFRSYARYWFDAFDVIDWSDERIREHFVFEGMEHMQEAIAQGNGAIAVLAHMGNWDAAGRAMKERGFLITAVAERLRPERLYRVFVRQREALGMRVIPLSKEGSVGRRLVAAAAENHVLALISDRDLTGKGVTVEMFGAPRKLPGGPAMLSLATGAPLIVCDVYQRKDGWHCVMHEPLRIESTGDRRADVTALTHLMAEAFERAISAAPSDWHLFQPGWED